MQEDRTKRWDQKSGEGGKGISPSAGTKNTRRPASFSPPYQCRPGCQRRLRKEEPASAEGGARSGLVWWPFALRRLGKRAASGGAIGKASGGAAMPKHEFFVDMTCEGCLTAVTRVLNKLGGVQFEIDLPNKKVSIDSTHDVDTLLDTLKKTGKNASYLGEK
ncbi:copper transport protein ATOX1 [Python bivittatus]|uniref:Copper transport protein ATOX1 n=1 Tax=Python bivittatus TaxID=176946 RepID=A0A9F2N4G6_PYTBI|nr:copper transport protein ATOX1 [Python bivittatus]